MMLEILLGKKKKGMVGIFAFNSAVITTLQNIDLSIAVGVVTLNTYKLNNEAFNAIGGMALTTFKGY